MQSWWADETSLKNIKNVTDPKLFILPQAKQPKLIKIKMPNVWILYYDYFPHSPQINIIIFHLSLYNWRRKEMSLQDGEGSYFCGQPYIYHFQNFRVRAKRTLDANDMQAFSPVAHSNSCKWERKWRALPWTPLWRSAEFQFIFLYLLFRLWSSLNQNCTTDFVSGFRGVKLTTKKERILLTWYTRPNLYHYEDDNIKWQCKVAKLVILPEGFINFHSAMIKQIEQIRKPPHYRTAL